MVIFADFRFVDRGVYEKKTSRIAAHSSRRKPDMTSQRWFKSDNRNCDRVSYWIRFPDHFIRDPHPREE